MRIINQRRNRSVNFDNIDISVDGTHIFGMDRKMILGQYDTEERALEVFEEMHKAYGEESMLLMNNIDFTKEGMDELKWMHMKTIFSQTSYPPKIERINGNVVYYMPTS